MPQQGLIVRALVASPGDVQQERQAIPEAIAAWNATHSLARAVIIEPVKWESHSVPGLEGRPQGMINRQLVEVCDFLVGVFWTRLGTDTGVAPSGTAEEIEEFRRAGKPVLLYFSSRPVDPDGIDLAQYERLKEYRKRLEPEGLYERYQDVGEFRGKLARHINSVIDRIVPAGSTPARPGTGAGDDPGDRRRVFIEQLETFARRLAADWRSERESEPHNLDGGKHILQFASGEIVNFLSSVAEDTENEIRGPLLEFARRLKMLNRHHLFVDGGRSYREFWRQGDEIISDFERLLNRLKTG